MPVKLNSTGGGSVSIDPPATVSNFTATMPAATGTVVLDSATQTLTNKSWSSPAGSTVSSGTAQASTSGTSIDFTSIPSWVKRVTVMFNAVSTSGSSLVQIQLGSGSVTTSGYVSSGWLANTTQSTSATGLLISGGNASTYGQWGSAVVTLVGSNIYSFSSCIASGPSGSTSMSVGAGGITLSGALDRVRITTVNGTDTFDLGTINILWE